MWTVELNIVGRRFTHEVHARRPKLGLAQRALSWRSSQLRQTRAA